MTFLKGILIVACLGAPVHEGVWAASFGDTINPAFWVSQGLVDGAEPGIDKMAAAIIQNDLAGVAQGAINLSFDRLDAIQKAFMGEVDQLEAKVVSDIHEQAAYALDRMQKIVQDEIDHASQQLEKTADDVMLGAFGDVDVMVDGWLGQAKSLMENTWFFSPNPLDTAAWFSVNGHPDFESKYITFLWWEQRLLMDAGPGTKLTKRIGVHEELAMGALQLAKYLDKRGLPNKELLGKYSLYAKLALGEQRYLLLTNPSVSNADERSTK